MAAKKDLLSIGIIYAAGQVLLQSVSFFLLPLYTHYLSVDQYGQFSLAATISDIIGFLLVLGIYSGYCRFYKDYPPDKRISLRNTAFTFAIIVGPVFTMLVILAAKALEPFIRQIDDMFTVLFYIALHNLFYQISLLFICTYYMEYRAKSITLINLARTVCSVLLIIYFLAFRREGMAGVYKGQMIASLGQLVYFLCLNRKSLKAELNIKMLKQMLKFGAGLLPSNLSASVLNFSDRFVMAGTRNFGETGIYSVGYKIGMQIDPLFTTPFRQIFTTYKYENWNHPDSRRHFDQMFLQYHVLGCFLLLCIAVFSRVFITVFTNEAYLEAYRIVPLILCAYFLYGETRFFNLGIELHNKTHLDSLILICGSLFNLLLNFILIPLLGMEGAALSTILSYILVLVLYVKVSGALYRIRYSYKKPLFLCLVTAVLYGIYYLFTLETVSVVYDLLMGSVLVAVYILICLGTGIIGRKEISSLLKSLSGFVKKK